MVLQCNNNVHQSDKALAPTKYSHQHPLHIIMQTHLRIDSGDVGHSCIALLRDWAAEAVHIRMLLTGPTYIYIYRCIYLAS